MKLIQTYAIKQKLNIEAVNNCDCDQRKLYKLVNFFTFGNKNMPYPNDNIAYLGINFGPYFIEKVDKKVEKIDNIKINEQFENVLN